MEEIQRQNVSRRTLSSGVLVIGQIVFWLSVLILPFSVYTGFTTAQLIISISQSALAGVLPAPEYLFFLFPIAMIVTLVAWIFHVRRAGLIALVALLEMLRYFPSNGDFSQMGIGYWICLVAVIATIVSAVLRNRHP